MYRKIMGFLEAWKESEHRKPLILQGARQVGKTYSILEFGRTHYENVAYFNFETNPKLNETFEENISPDYLIPILSHIAGQTIVKEKTLIVFDEVQLCERALTSHSNTFARTLQITTSSSQAACSALQSTEQNSLFP